MTMASRKEGGGKSLREKGRSGPSPPSPGLVASRSPEAARGGGVKREG